jgi:hypothetical protein
MGAWGGVQVAGDPTDPANYGIAAGVASVTQLGPATSGGVATSTGQINAPWSPNSPLFWVAALLAVTVGAAGFNAHARVLNVRGGVDVGKS